MSTQLKFNELLDKLKKTYPAVSFLSSETFYWSPKNKTVYYAANKPHAKWSLIHELSHALLDHNSYQTDFELLLLEVAAWEKAEHLAAELKIELDKEYVQDCLDTYRDWLHRRSECPTCQMRGLQINPTTYQCTNCLNEWHVSMARFCRPYRRQVTAK
jgi:hypothetical protein